MAQSAANVSGSEFTRRKGKRPGEPVSNEKSKLRPMPSHFQRELGEEVFSSLEVIKRDILLGGPVHWDTLLRVLRAMKIEITTAPECLKVAIEVLGVFERHRCKDASVILEVFSVMFSLTAYRLQSVERDKLRIIGELIYKPYGTECSLGIDFVHDAVISANIGLLKLQLRFGLGIIMPYFTDVSFDYLEDLLRGWPGVDMPHGLYPDFRIYDKICSVYSPESRKRHCLVLRVLEIVRTMYVGHQAYRQHFPECYRLLFDSIPEPYITSVEVEAVLEKYLPAAYSGLIPEITEVFQRMLPKLAEVPQPRSLKHLCRIQVRDSLRQNMNLLHGVSSLPLPNLLKEYIMLHDDGDYSIFASTILRACHREQDRYWPMYRIKIPEQDDCITSFLKSI